MRVLYAALCIAIFAGTGTAFAQEDTDEFVEKLKRSSLKGIKTAVVSVAINQGDKKISLTPKQVQTDVEIELQKAGIRVVTVPNGPDEPAPDALIHFQIELMPLPDIGHHFVLLTSVSQQIALERDRSIRTLGTTWSKLTVGGNFVVDRQIRETATDHSKSVANDWLKANPK